MMLAMLHIPQVNPLLVDIVVMWVLHTVHCIRRYNVRRGSVGGGGSQGADKQAMGSSSNWMEE
jgi:hypothetical protein